MVIQTWGNASGIDRKEGLVVIKPSGVSYATLTSDQMVVVDLKGNRVWGDLNPSVDLATHLVLYAAFDNIGSVIHTHSLYAVCFAQARLELPCLGTTHADYFHGAVPLTPAPNENTVDRNYESGTGEMIVHTFAGRNPLACPAALVAGHGPFVWGETVEKCFENACVLESLAQMAWHTLTLNPAAPPLEAYLQEKHFLRKHGASAYYGQERPLS